MARSNAGRRRRRLTGAGAPARPSKAVTPGPRAAWEARLPLLVLAIYGTVLLGVQLLWHTTPTYAVETDLMGEFIPAARHLLAGHLEPELYAFRGFGYPLLLAAGSWLTGGDLFLASRLWNVAAALGGAWFAFALFRDFLGPRPGLFVLIGLLVDPVFVRASIETGTDLPAFALSLATTYWALRSGEPGAIALAGFLAGFAYIVRYSAASLVAAAFLVLLWSPGRRRLALWYGLGLALPVGAWLLVNREMTGSAWTNRNYLNVAYAVYGRNVQWDRFWSTVGTEFHSMADVVRHDPAAFAAGIARNLATHWWTDLHQLVPLWLGVFAIPGMLLWTRRPGWPGILAYFGTSYVTLAFVFYVDRFFLYLAPFYLAGAATFFHPPALAVRDRLARFAAALRRFAASRARDYVVAGLFLASAVQAAIPVYRLLSEAPFEVRKAASLLERMGPPGARVMARKPHVPYLAGMELVRYPAGGTLGQLLATAREDSVRYLYFSGLEASLRPDLQVLFDPESNLPGLRQVAREDYGGAHWFSLHSVSPQAPDSAAEATALVRLLRRFVELHPEEPVSHLALAAQLIQLRSYPEALDALARAERLDPDHPAIFTLRAQAYVETGRFDEGARAAERAIELDANRAWCDFVLGQIDLRRGRFAEARKRFQEAVAIEPTNVVYLRLLGLADLKSGAAGLAVGELERAFALDSLSRVGNLLRAAAYREAGQRQRAGSRIAARASAGDSLPPLPALVDSLWVELR